MCKIRMKPICLSLLQAPGTGFTPEKYDTCAKAYTTADCDELLVFGFRPAACQVQGTLASGAACGDGSQCISGFCAMDFFTVCGVCADPIAAGGKCSKSSQCQGDLGCVSPGTCTKLAKQGESCTSLPCAGGLKCMNGTCSSPLTAGTACDPDKDYCDGQIGLQCDSAARKCVDLPTAAIGSTCSHFELCLASGYCNASGSPTVCEAATNDGAACDLGNSECKYPAQCVAHVCTTPNAVNCR
jgi:hypothetical protein